MTDDPLSPLESALIRDEGLSLRLYDVQGVPHLGVGHNLRAGPDLSRAAVLHILRDDIRYFTERCQSLAPWPALSAPRRDVLVNLCFTLGVAGLRGFVRLFEALSQADYARAGDEIVASQLPGPRAQRLAEQMRTGAWP